MVRSFGSRLLIALVAALFFATPALAVPGQLQVEGVLLSSGGAPAADGDYDVTFSLYAAASGGTAVWSEGPNKIKITGGRFAATLGGSKAIDAAALGDGSRWLGVTVGSDPELPRQPLRSVAYAIVAGTASAVSCSGCVSGDQIANGAVAAAKLGFNYAGSNTKGGPALDLACSGCVTVGEMKFDGDVDLGGNSLKAGNGTFTGDVSAKTVTATSFVGDGSKLTGIKQPSGDCKAGETVVGIAADGTLKCAAGAGGNKVLDGMVTTEFNEAAKVSGLPVAIPDNTGSEAVIIATYGKVGTANTIAVDIEIENTDLSTLSIKLLPPDDKAKGLTICDPCGDKDAKSYKVQLTEKSTLKDGSLATYIGKTIDGGWTLKVLDASFCIVQAPGNGTICKPSEKVDGNILSFSINAKVTSTVSVGTSGTFQFGTLAKPPFVCEAAKAGHAFYDTAARKVSYCDGAIWRFVGALCGDGVVQPGEDCDDGNFDDTDGCTTACSAAAAKKTCAEILAADKAAKSAWYTIDLDGPNGVIAPQRVWCDMTTDGGGWTRFIRHVDPDGSTPITWDDWDAGILMAARGGIKQWMVKTFTDPKQTSDSGAAHYNAWSMDLVSGYQGKQFAYFRHAEAAETNQHRASGTGWISSAKLLPGSACKSFYGSDAGRYIWLEHYWAETNVTGWMWMTRCSTHNNAHMLIVNHNYTYPRPTASMIGASTSPGGEHAWYDEDGGTWEFFFR